MPDPKFTKEYFETVINSCRKEQEVQRMNFERQEGVIRFCQMVLEKEFKTEVQDDGIRTEENT